MDQQVTPGDAPKKSGRAKKKDQDQKANGQANGAANGQAAAPVQALPGEQGIATQGTIEDPSYSPPAPTQGELNIASDVYGELNTEAHDLADETVIEKLMQIVDVHPELVTPHDWKGEADEEYREAPVISRMVSILCRGCNRIEVSSRKVIPLWRNKERWTSSGQKVRGVGKGLDKRARFLTDGAHAVVEINFHLFKTMNPRQKVFTVYHALRSIDADGKRRAPDFNGYYDELELFGAGTFREMVAMANSLERGAARNLPYQLSLLEEFGETEA